MATQRNPLEEEAVNEEQLELPFEMYPGTPEDLHHSQEEAERRPKKACGCRKCRC